MNREQQFIKNSFILSIGTIFPKITSLITLPIITGCLTQAEYGTYDLILILVMLALPIATMQLQSAAFRFLVDLRNNHNKQKEVITNILVFTIVVSLVTVFIIYFFLFGMNWQTRILISIYLLVDILLQTVKQITRGLARNFVYSMSAIINSTSELILTIILVLLMNKGLDGAILVLIISQFISLIYVLINIKLWSYINLSFLSFNILKEMLSYSWPMVPNSLSSWVIRVSDRLILLWFMGVEANAIYAVANKLPNIFSVIQSTFTLSWQENATVAVKDDDSSEYYGKMFDNIFDILVGCMAILIAFTPIIFAILIRGDYQESYNHMPILYLASMFSAISAYLGGIYIAHMKSKEIGITTTLAAIINFIINILFVNYIGIYAATISTLLSYFLLAIYRMFDVQKFQKINFNYKKIIFLVCVLSVMSFICFLRKTLLDIINMIMSIFLAVILNKQIIKFSINTVVKKIKKVDNY